MALSCGGNHELYNFDRAELEELNVTEGDRWYSFRPTGKHKGKSCGWRVIVLDSFEINAIESDGERGLAAFIRRQPSPRTSRCTVAIHTVCFCGNKNNKHAT
eukprot:4532941-Amphidinium_carterae.1